MENLRRAENLEPMWPSITRHRISQLKSLQPPMTQVWCMVVTCRLGGYHVTSHLTVTCFTGADVILDFVGASYLEKHARCIALEGRIVHLGFVRMFVGVVLIT